MSVITHARPKAWSLRKQRPLTTHTHTHTHTHWHADVLVLTVLVKELNGSDVRKW